MKQICGVTIHLTITGASALMGGPVCRCFPSGSDNAYVFNWRLGNYVYYAFLDVFHSFSSDTVCLSCLSRQVTVVRQEYEEKIKGLMPTELRQELEDTITSLKAQVRTDCLTETDQIGAEREWACWHIQSGYLSFKHVKNCLGLMVLFLKHCPFLYTPHPELLFILFYMQNLLSVCFGSESNCTNTVEMLVTPQVPTYQQLF